MSTITTEKTVAETEGAWFVNFREETIRHLRNLVAGRDANDSQQVVNKYMAELPSMTETVNVTTILEAVSALQNQAPTLNEATALVRRDYENEAASLFRALRELSR